VGCISLVTQRGSSEGVNRSGYQTASGEERGREFEEKTVGARMRGLVREGSNRRVPAETPQKQPQGRELGKKTKSEKRSRKETGGLTPTGGNMGAAAQQAVTQTG